MGRDNIVMCKHNESKVAYGKCMELSDEGSLIRCGSTNTDDAQKRCKFFAEMTSYGNK